jgi:TatD DNase family protein
MELFDSHCHIHEIVERLTPVHDKWLKGGVTDVDDIIATGIAAGVNRAIVVGTSEADSALAVKFVSTRENLWASIGIHPHEAKEHIDVSEKLERFAKLAENPKVKAVGECGLDYFYTHSPKEQQLEILKYQLDIAKKHDLPLIFHVREAFDDFWPIFDQFEGLRGVIHSFSANTQVLDQILARGLYVGLNGIMTFTKRTDQLDAAKAVPLDKLLLETDAPFLTPAPERGTICRLEHVRVTAEFLAALRGEKLDNLAAATTQNARNLFNV